MESLNQIEGRTESQLARRDVGLVEITDKDIQQLGTVPQTLDRIYKSIMREGTDYGKIPGTPKPSLWKPGAELLARWLNLVPQSKLAEKVEDWSKPFFMYKVETSFYNREGLFVGNGFGSANTGETRYAWRWVPENSLPTNANKQELESKSDNGRKLYKIPTSASEIFTLQNTVLKMAKKRSFIDGILSITGASRIFTQEIEDDEHASEQKAQEAKTVGSGVARSPSSSTGRRIIRYFETSDKQRRLLPPSHPMYEEFVNFCSALRKDHPGLEYEFKREKTQEGEKIASVTFQNPTQEVEKTIASMMTSIADSIDGENK
jgi:hypothetical protein